MSNHIFSRAAHDVTLPVLNCFSGPKAGDESGEFSNFAEDRKADGP
jgi:hypothetical protein